MPYFQTLGLNEIQQRYRTGEKRRMKLLYQTISIQYVPLARVVIKANILTGNDCISNVGTKYAALTSDAVQYLINLDETDFLSEEDATLAEKFQVCAQAGVWSETTATPFDQLRLDTYTTSACPIEQLPPTSSVFCNHITRVAYLVNQE